MLFKQTLIDQSIYLKAIPEKYLSIDYKKIKKEALESFTKKQKINSNEFSFYKNYYKLTDNLHVNWIYDLIRDYYNLDFKGSKTLILNKSYYIVLNRNSDIDFHNHIDEYNIKNSPDFTAIVSLTENKNDFVEFEFEGGRKRQMKQRVPLNKGEVILFNSELRHRFITERFHENLLLLSFQMQLHG